MEKKKTSLAKLCPKSNKALEENWAGQGTHNLCNFITEALVKVTLGT